MGIRIKKSVSNLFLVFIFSVTGNQIYAQGVKEIIIQNADSILSDKNIANGANRLIGNVEIIINEALMKCDSAYYFPAERLVEAFSHVHINRADTLQLWGDYMQYNELDSMIRVKDNVVLVNNDAKLYTQILNYNLVSDVGYYPVEGIIYNGDNTLSSKTGYFYSKINTAVFNDSVIIKTPDYTIYSNSLKYNTEQKITYFLDSTDIYSEENHIFCENGEYNTQTKIFLISKNAQLENTSRSLTGDSIYYDDNLQFGIARSNVTINDTSKNIILTSNYAEYYKVPEKAYLTKEAVLIQIIENDSLFLHADTLKLNTDSANNRVIFAYYNVKFFKSNMQGMCDSMYFSQKDSVLQFHGEPVLWSGENQITGNYMEIYMKNDVMDRMEIIGNSFLGSIVDTNQFNQVKGKHMTGYFNKNELDLIDVMGNGQTVYYLKDDNDMIGVNLSICSNMKIYVKDRRPFIIKNLVKPDATLYPTEQAPKDQLVLENFKWLDKYRPKKKSDIFLWK